MAALNFPANPVNGQVYGAYTYDSSVAPGFWRSAAASNASTYVSLTAPSSTTAGDLWWKSDTGESFVNYWDGSSYQWVQTQSPVTGAGYVSPNYIINGAMDINQRNFSSQTFTSAQKYTFDRWTVWFTGTGTASVQGFTPGTSLAPSFEGTNGYLRTVLTSGTANTEIDQRIEDVRTLAGRTVTVSFWAKFATAATANVVMYQSMDSTGATLAWSNTVSQTVGTTWQRYTAQITIPSIAGRTIGSGSYLTLRFTHTTTNNAFDIWGVQLEEGLAATAFRRNANSIQGELAACQRYYQRFNSNSAYGTFGMGFSVSSTSIFTFIDLKQMMRAPVTAVEFSGAFQVEQYSLAAVTVNDIAVTGYATNHRVWLNLSVTGATVAMGGYLRSLNNSSTYLAFSAEL